MTVSLEGVQVIGPLRDRYAEILTPEALRFIARLQREFGAERKALLDRRTERQARLDAGELPDFLVETRDIRESDWRVAEVPAALQNRRVEITGPVEAKMMINAFNSGAQVFMADFEDANSPTWDNVVQGHMNLREAIAGTISFTSPDGRQYRLKPETATLMVRPRGWHLLERNILVDGEHISASLADFGLYFFHNARALLAKGAGPFFYLPKLESHREARLWNEVFCFAQEYVGVPRGSIKATVLIETILAAFEMEEILYELREHSAGLNAGRWDYIFSVIKKFRNRPDFILPDRAQVTMTVPFMRAYTKLLVKTCHRRGAHAIGGMAAFIPNRKNPQVTENALAKVREDKLREVGDGFDGTWVAHPDLVPVALEVFDARLGDRPNKLDRQRDDVSVTAADLLNVKIPGGRITEAGLRTNINVGVQYVESWLRGVGAAAIHNLMEDAATAEISRSQVWQWIRHGAYLQDGEDHPRISAALVRLLVAEELESIAAAAGEVAFARGRYGEAAALFVELCLSERYAEFLTVPAYQMIH